MTARAEAGIGGALFGHSPVELGAYQLVRDQGRLPLRVQLMVAAETLRPVAAHAADGILRALDLGLRTGFGDDRLSVGALKIYTTFDRETNCPVPIDDEEVLREVLGRMRAAGVPESDDYPGAPCG